MNTKVYIRSFIEQLLPQQCQLCRRQSDTAWPLCSGCEQDLPWLEHGCLRCSEPLPISSGQSICGHCQKHPPAFAHCFAALRYDFPIDILIQRFKDSAEIPRVQLLAQLFVQRWHTSRLACEPPELLLPVPLHQRRLYQRGFNQSLELAERLGRLLALPVDPRICRRVANTPHQIGLDAKQRRKNLANAFQVDSQQLRRAKHLALVDDVVTTGATAQALSQALLSAGAERVDIWCLAKTPRARTSA